jgi:hypothetical protein
VTIADFTAYPKSTTRPIQPEVIDPYRTDFQEAALVLVDSPKADKHRPPPCLGGWSTTPIAPRADAIRWGFDGPHVAICPSRRLCDTRLNEL